MSNDPKPVAEAPQVDDPAPAGSAILRAMRVMEAIAASPAPPQLAEICKAVELPKPTVFRILATLEVAGLVGREPGSKRYHCGRRLSTLAADVLLHSPNRAARHAILEELVEHTGETCNLTIPNGNAVMYLDRVETAWPLRIALGAGSSVPLHASASGKLFLAHMPKAQRARLLAARPLWAATPNTLVAPEAIEKEMRAIVRQGYSLDREEFLLGLIAIAVPVPGRDGQPVAALAVHAPMGRLSLKRAIGLLPVMRETATALGASLAA